MRFEYAPSIGNRWCCIDAGIHIVFIGSGKRVEQQGVVLSIGHFGDFESVVLTLHSVFPICRKYVCLLERRADCKVNRGIERPGISSGWFTKIICAKLATRGSVCATKIIASVLVTTAAHLRRRRREDVRRNSIPGCINGVGRGNAKRDALRVPINVQYLHRNRSTYIERSNTKLTARVVIAYRRLGRAFFCRCGCVNLRKIGVLQEFKRIVCWNSGR